MRNKRTMHLMAILCLVATFVNAQSADTSTGTVAGCPTKLFKNIRRKAADMDNQLSGQSVKYLTRLSRIDARLLKQLQKVDTGIVKRIPASAWQHWIDRVRGTSGTASSVTGQCYIPHLDTLQTTLKFLQDQQGFSTSGSNNAGVALGQAGTQVQQLQAHLDQSVLVSQYINDRKQQLKQLIGQYTHLPLGVTQSFSQFKETGYYYRQQVEEYRKILSNPQKTEERAVNLLSRLPAYQQFMSRNSLLAKLFPMPADNGSNVLQGLQTRDQLQQVLQQQVSAGGAGGLSAVDQQMNQAQTQLGSMQRNLSKYGAGGQNIDLPGFTPNQQKTRTFWRRVIYGMNLQLAKSSTYYPATGNVGASIGYKINDCSTAGLGASYNIGLGSGWNHMQFSSQEIGLRSFMDWQIKKTYYITGGYEENYLTQFSSFAQLKNKTAWQPSGLIGLEKKYKLSGKLQGNIQLLYDLLYRQVIPAGQMFKFRVGYSF